MDIPETGIIIFCVVIALFIVYMILSQFGVAIQSNNQTNITSVVDNFQNFESKQYAGWDYGVLLIAILFPLVSFLLARKIPVNKAVVIILIVVSPIFIIFMMIISNLHGGFMENLTYQAFIETTNFIRFIMPKLGVYAVLYLIFVMVGLFTKDE